MNDLSSQFMSEADVASLLGVSVQATREWRTRRVGPPYIKTGKRVLYRAEAVRAYLLDRERDPAAARHGGGRNAAGRKAA